MREIKITEEQERELQEAFRCLVALYSAEENKDHYSTCACYHIEPFNNHWDKKTVEEVKQHVRMYINSWILPQLESVLNLKRTPVLSQMEINWHKTQIRKLEQLIEK
jgi:hypothetical protein